MAKIYVGTYAKYNNGSIAGAWLDCEDYSDYEEFIEACKELHKDEQDAELMFQDFEEFPKDFYSESGIDPKLWDYLAMDDDEKEIVDAWMDSEPCPDDITDIIDWYTGTYDNWEDYAEQLSGEYGNVPDHLKYYIDYEKMGRDMMMDHSGTYSEYQGKLFLFANF